MAATLLPATLQVTATLRGATLRGGATLLLPKVLLRASQPGVRGSAVAGVRRGSGFEGFGRCGGRLLLLRQGFGQPSLVPGPIKIIPKVIFIFSDLSVN